MSRDKLWPLQRPGRKNQRRSQAAWHWRSKYSFLHLKKTYLWNALKAFFPFPGNVHRKILTDISYQQIYAPNLECKGVATASHNAIKPGRSCQKLSNNIVQSMQMNANHIQASWIIMVLDTQISSNIYIYIYIYIYIIFITSSWSSFSPMIDSFHLRNSSRSIHRQRRALATVARRWDIGSAGPTWPSPAFPASCNTIKIHWRRQKNRQRHTKFRDVFFSFKSLCHSFGVVLAS